MFDLEQSIADWRQQMLAVGIKSPALDELENHLREVAERQIEAGVSNKEAFQNAVNQLGTARVLTTEFAKSKSLWGDGYSTRTDQILGTIWAVANAWPAYMSCYYFVHDFLGLWTSAFWINLFFTALYGAMFVGGLLLFCGSYVGRCLVRSMAMVLFICCVAQILANYGSISWREWCGLWAIISSITVALLHRPELADSRQWPKLKSMGVMLAVSAIVVGAQLQMWTDDFISIHRHGVHGEIIFHWPVFLILGLHLVGILCLVKPMRWNFSKG